MERTFFGSGATSTSSAAPVTLTDAATVATDASKGTRFRVTIAGDRTIGAPTNSVDGQRASWDITASGADRLPTLASGTGGFKFASGLAGPLTAVTSGTTDVIGAEYHQADNRWWVLGIVKGY